MIGEHRMARRGRRLVDAREPNGRPQREREFPPTMVRRLRDAAMRGLRDQEWGTELGRLFLEKAITEEMYAAGRKWGEEAEKYRESIGTYMVKTAAMQRGSIGHDADPDSDEGRVQARRERDGMERFFASHAALMAAGTQAESAVRRLCEEGLSLAGMMEFQAARSGLLALATHYGLTIERK